MFIYDVCLINQSLTFRPNSTVINKNNDITQTYAKKKAAPYFSSISLVLT